MKKSQVALIIVGVLATVGLPSVIAINQANQAQVAIEYARQESLQVKEEAEAERQALAEKQEALKAEADRLAQEETARREEDDRLAAEQRRQVEEQLAAQQREQEQLAARTAEAWGQFMEVMANVESYSSDNPDADPVASLKYIVDSLEPISLRQVDPKVATLIGDMHDTASQMHGFVVDFQAQQQQLGVDVAEAAKFGCEAVNATQEQSSLGWCFVGGLLGSSITYASGNEALEQLEADYMSRIESLAPKFEAYKAEIETMPSYLQETYGIDVTDI